MNPQNTQPDTQSGMPDMQGLNPDQISANLAFATHLNEQMLPQDAPQAPVDSQNAPQQDSQQQMPLDMIQELDTIKTQFQTELSGLKEETRKIITDEITKLRTDIQDAIANEQT